MSPEAPAVYSPALAHTSQPAGRYALHARTPPPPLPHSDLHSPPFSRAAARYARIQMHAPRIHPARRRKHRPKSCRGARERIPPLCAPSASASAPLCAIFATTTLPPDGQGRRERVAYSTNAALPSPAPSRIQRRPWLRAMSGGARREVTLIPWTGAAFTTQCSTVADHAQCGVLERAALRACRAFRVKEDERAARREVSHHGGTRGGNSFDDEDLEEGVANDYARCSVANQTHENRMQCHHRAYGKTQRIDVSPGFVAVATSGTCTMSSHWREHQGGRSGLKRTKTYLAPQILVGKLPSSLFWHDLAVEEKDEGNMVAGREESRRDSHNKRPFLDGSPKIFSYPAMFRGPRMKIGMGVKMKYPEGVKNQE
ncbi:hypothetical protein B0H11DRAFT_1938593 [Mycena galericulata]|nr:hypothetical protein B0H11DRAFT_1938593 [Mycena galericulata]